VSNKKQVAYDISKEGAKFMNTLLLFFAFPIATILLAIVLEKVLESPTLVGITFFAIYLIITFAFFDSDFLIFAIVYTVIAFVSAFVVRFIKNCLLRFCCRRENESRLNTSQEDGSSILLANVNTNSNTNNNPRVITGRIELNNTLNGRCCRRR